MGTPSPNSFVLIPRILRRRRKWVRIADDIAIIVLAILSVVFLPVIIPVVTLLDFIYRKRLKAASCTFACLACGGILGHESIRLADEAWGKHVRKLREN